MLLVDKPTPIRVWEFLDGGGFNKVDPAVKSLVPFP